MTHWLIVLNNSKSKPTVFLWNRFLTCVFSIRTGYSVGPNTRANFKVSDVMGLKECRIRYANPANLCLPA